MHLCTPTSKFLQGGRGIGIIASDKRSPFAFLLLPNVLLLQCCRAQAQGSKDLVCNMFRLEHTHSNVVTDMLRRRSLAVATGVDSV